VFGLAIERVGAVLKDALHPLIKEQPGTVDELVQHTRWKEIGQFQFEMMDQVLIYTNGLDALNLSRQERYSFRNQSESNNNARTIQVRIRLSKSSDNAIPASIRGSKVHKKNLIVVMMDDCTQCLPATHQIRRRKLTFKHGKLKMIPKPTHQLEDLP
jgi:hypothetical protein